MSKTTVNISRHFDIQKVVVDYIKHLIGLATGTIILLTIMLDKFSDKVKIEVKLLVGSTLICCYR